MEHFHPYEEDLKWWFDTAVGKFGPCASKMEALTMGFTIKLAAENIVAEARALCGGCFDELIGLPVAFVGPLVGLSTEQARRRMPVLQASERDSRVSLKDVRSFIKDHTKPPKPLTRNPNAVPT
jgi:hypothetical protein